MYICTCLHPIHRRYVLYLRTYVCMYVHVHIIHKCTVRIRIPIFVMQLPSMAVTFQCSTCSTSNYVNFTVTTVTCSMYIHYVGVFASIFAIIVIFPSLNRICMWTLTYVYMCLCTYVCVCRLNWRSLLFLKRSLETRLKECKTPKVSLHHTGNMHLFFSLLLNNSIVN